MIVALSAPMAPVVPLFVVADSTKTAKPRMKERTRTAPTRWANESFLTIRMPLSSAAPPGSIGSTLDGGLQRGRGSRVAGCQCRHGSPLDRQRQPGRRPDGERETPDRRFGTGA